MSTLSGTALDWFASIPTGHFITFQQFSKMGPKPDTWCEFHKSFGYSINSCLALGYQLAELVKCGFLKDYFLEKQADQSAGSQPASNEGQ